jgi:hypothetical protein
VALIVMLACSAASAAWVGYMSGKRSGDDPNDRIDAIINGMIGALTLILLMAWAIFVAILQQTPHK